MIQQPDDFTCGPTSLHAVYGYMGDALDLQDIIGGISYLEEGGTLAVHLGLHALERGYGARLYSYNLRVFDPTWAGLEMDELERALAARQRAKRGAKLIASIQAYRDFIAAGGLIRFDAIDRPLLEHYFDQGLPVLAGLSATYLYASPRERLDESNRMVFDDVRGEPQGHFVVLCGYDGNEVVVADPLKDNPIAGDHHYRVDVDRLIRAILLGVLTYDANLLVIERKGDG